MMTGARSYHFSDPGEFRRSQNWIGGTTIDNALYVPPTVDDMVSALNDLEKFINQDHLMPMVHTALLHAQFETIHPFLYGNGRTGRLLINLFLYERQLLEKPVLFLSSYFKKHQKIYYQMLEGYHNGSVFEWVEFFLDAVIETAHESIEMSKKIAVLVEADMRKIQALGKREAESGVKVLQNLYNTPIVNSIAISGFTGFSRNGAQKVIDRFIALDILQLRNESDMYGRTYIYKRYVDIFQ